MIKRQAFLILLGFLSTLLSCLVQAEGLDDYYVVELTIFTHDSPENALEEEWRKNLSLNYPAKLAYFTDEDFNHIYPELADLLKKASEEDDNTDSSKSLDETTTDEMEPPDTELSNQINLEETNTETGGPLTEAINTEDGIIYPPIFLPLIDKSYQEHKDITEKLNWSKKYSVLLTQTWLQKFESEETAPNIVIQAGETVSDIHQLAGTIKLFKERYLHLQTNLWLVSFLEEPSESPEAEIPKPNENTLISVASLETETTTTSDVLTIDIATESDASELEERWPIPPKVTIPIFGETHNIVNNKTTETDEKPLLLEVNPQATENPEPAEAPIERIVLMQQKRKMRSHEIHYIDHPLFGLIIEVRPYQKQ